MEPGRSPLSFFRQSTTTFLSRILVTLVNIPISILIARRLGAEGQGAYSAAIALSSLFATSVLLSVDAAHTYYLAGRKRTLREVVGNSLLWSVVLGVLATPLYLLLAPLVRRESGTPLDAVLALSAAAVPLLIARSFVLSIFLGENKVDRYNLLQVGSNLILLALLLATLLTPHPAVRAAIWAYLVSLAALLLTGGLWIARELRHREGAGPWTSRPLFRDGFLYGVKGHIGVFFAQFTYRFDQILVTRIAGLEAQGYYSIAAALAEKLTLISSSVHLVLFPRVSASTKEEANRLTPVAVRFTLVLVLCAAVVLWFLGGFLVRLFYTRAFEPALPAFRVLLPGIVVLSLSRLLSGDLSGRARRLPQTIALGSAFLLNLGLDLLWIPRHGIVGAAWASTIAYAWQTIILLFVFWKASGVSPAKLLTPNREDVARVRSLLGRVASGGRAA